MARQGRFCRRLLIFLVSGTMALFADTRKFTVYAENLEQAWAAATANSRKLHAERHQIQSNREVVHAARALRSPIISNQTAIVAMPESPRMTSHATISLPPPFSILQPLVPPITAETSLADKTFVTNSTIAAVPLYAGGKIRSAIDAANAQVHASVAEYAASTQNVRMEITEIYFMVLRTRRLCEIAFQAENSLAQHERNSQKMLETRLVTRNVVLAAQTAKSLASQNTLRAKIAVQTAEAAYNRLLNRPLETPVELEEINIPPMLSDQPEIRDNAARNRSELTQLQSQAQALNAQSRIARADRLPQVVAGGSITYLENRSIDPNTLFAGGIGVSWTPFDGGASRAKQRAAAQGAMAVNQMREETRSLIELQVQTAVLAEQESRSRIQVAENGVNFAEENLRVVTMQFQSGLVNHTEVLDAQTLAANAQANYYNAVYDAILATYRLKRALGIF
ncbi:MAG: TolC family protein [Planctomycetaceae bacterium]|jgi:outer membrane protein TolC|nr:TolC family protein [Planctomycetaceae bacterium]